MNVTFVPDAALDALRPHPSNPREHDDAEIAALAERFRLGDQPDPVLAVRAPDGQRHVIDGTLRLKAAGERGWATLPCIEMTAAEPDQEIVALTKMVGELSGRTSNIGKAYAMRRLVDLNDETVGHNMGSQSETASRLGISEGTLRNHLNRADLADRVRDDGSFTLEDIERMSAHDVRAALAAEADGEARDRVDRERRVREERQTVNALRRVAERDPDRAIALANQAIAEARQAGADIRVTITNETSEQSTGSPAPPLIDPLAIERNLGAMLGTWRIGRDLDRFLLAEMGKVADDAAVNLETVRKLRRGDYLRPRHARLIALRTVLGKEILTREGARVLNEIICMLDEHMSTGRA